MIEANELLAALPVDFRTNRDGAGTAKYSTPRKREQSLVLDADGIDSDHLRSLNLMPLCRTFWSAGCWLFTSRPEAPLIVNDTVDANDKPTLTVSIYSVAVANFNGDGRADIVGVQRCLTTPLRCSTSCS
jgi:hypothetical protein